MSESKIIVREMTILDENDAPTKPEKLRCTLCGWVIEDRALATFTSDTEAVHYDRTCPKGDTKPAPKKRAPRKSVPVKGDEIVVKEMKIVGLRGAHAECDHAATKSARATCRKAHASK